MDSHGMESTCHWRGADAEEEDGGDDEEDADDVDGGVEDVEVCEKGSAAIRFSSDSAYCFREKRRTTRQRMQCNKMWGVSEIAGLSARFWSSCCIR